MASRWTGTESQLQRGSADHFGVQADYNKSLYLHFQLLSDFSEPETNAETFAATEYRAKLYRNARFGPVSERLHDCLKNKLIRRMGIIVVLSR